MSEKNTDVKYGNMPASVLEEIKTKMCMPRSVHNIGTDMYYKEFAAYGLPVLAKRWPDESAQAENARLSEEITFLTQQRDVRESDAKRQEALLADYRTENFKLSVGLSSARAEIESLKAQAIPKASVSAQAPEPGVTRQLINVLKVQQRMCAPESNGDLRVLCIAAREALVLDIGRATKAINKKLTLIGVTETALVDMEGLSWENLPLVGEVLGAIIFVAYHDLLQDKVKELLQKL